MVADGWAEEPDLIDALNNRMLFGALSNLRLAPHVREGGLGGVAVAADASSPVHGTKAPRSSVAVPQLDGRNLQAAGPTSALTSAPPSEEKLSLSPAALAALREESPAAPAIASFEAGSYGRIGAHGVEMPMPPVASAEPTAGAAAMALAARAYGDDFRLAGTAATTASVTTAAPSTGPARLSSLGVLRA